jgi:hypothetical protein
MVKQVPGHSKIIHITIQIPVKFYFFISASLSSILVYGYCYWVAKLQYLPLLNVTSLLGATGLKHASELINEFFRANFKGTVSRDFLLLVFFMNQFPPSP